MSESVKVPRKYYWAPDENGFRLYVQGLSPSSTRLVSADRGQWWASFEGRGSERALNARDLDHAKAIVLEKIARQINEVLEEDPDWREVISPAE